MKFKLRNLIFTGLLVSIGILLSQLFSFYYPPSTSIIKFGIGYVPLIIISLMFGPEVGFFAGITQDFIGYFLLGSSRGVFYFGFTFNAILYGVVPGLIMKLKSKVKPSTFFISNIVLMTLFAVLAIVFLFHIDSISSNVNFLPMYRYLLVGLALLSSLAMILISILHYRKHQEKGDIHFIFFVVFVLYILTSLILTPLWLYDLYAIPFWVQIPLRIVKMPIEVLIYTIILERLLKVLFNQIERNE
ncbi:MAG: folate family ECF transporter S component [Firmicutes bacterium]|nr:folate family ECF transporter S component [Bacillota bacterium]